MSVVDRFVAWRGNVHLFFNVTKSKEMVGDFRRTGTMLNTISILGEEIEVVEGCRYLGVHLDNRLDWKCNIGVNYRKGQSRLYFLRKFIGTSMCAARCCRSSTSLLWQM